MAFLWLALCMFSECVALNQARGRVAMQMAITFIAVVAGMVLSLAVALLAEELIFGQVFRVFFVRRTVKTEGKR
jgi:hypothetical protein